MSLDNAAGRLHYWLHIGSQGDQSHAALPMWCHHFDLDVGTPQGQAECMRRCAALMDLGVQVRREAELLPPEVHADLILSHYSEVETVLNRLTQVGALQIAGLYSGLKPTGWHSLSLISAMLSTYRPEKTLDEDRVDGFIKDTENLLIEVKSDDALDEKVKGLIASRLNDVLDALRLVDLRGTPPIEKATDALVTAVWRACGGLWLKESSTGRKITALVVAIGFALEMGANFKALLPAPSDPPAIVQQITVENDTTVTIVVPSMDEPAKADAAEGGPRG